ncbi:MAG: tRNA (adenosine(37)-N6)-threonylcarbamoyltransferase complex transferase subunit TsaD [Clostridiales bacterium]|nr:tRNA (adenosine(37)-N6)-threonylcarbamoyltransferase complex transferase subunit TsaD [Clostridiales bacterium]
MKILAIESSCDDTAAAVVEDGRNVLSNVVSSQIKEHIVYGGVVPEIASRMHTQAICAVCRKALADANAVMKDIDAVAVTYAPGLIGALLVGVNFAKGLAYSCEKPLIPVHHLRSHIASNYISSKSLEPPFLALVVSGGHSHIVSVESYTQFKVIGKTLDDAAGECMDKCARVMGIDYPGGYNLDRLCKNGNPRAFVLPKPKVEGSDYNLSFSGLKTAVINIVHKFDQKGETYSVEDLGASCIDTVTDCLVKNISKAAANYGFKKIAVAGGVSANSVLRKKMNSLCAENGYELYMPELKYCGDNAAMVGSQGYYEFLSGKVASLDLNAYATMNIEIG